MLISLGEYAKLKNKDKSRAIRKAQNGDFKTAKKIGNQWVVSSNEEWIDRRRKKEKEQ